MLKSGKSVFYFLGLLLFLNLAAGLVALDLSKVRPLEVIFFDVGQGDAIFIQDPRSHQILIDGGPSFFILEKLAKAMPFWDRTIDLIILTHPEKDHLAGLLEVLKTYRVENILWTGVIRETSEFKEWERVIQEEGANVKIGQAHQSVILIPESLHLEVLYPLENLAGQTFKDSNETSLVSRLVFKNNSFLFTGDIYQSDESKIMESGQQLDSDVLKVSHHGSKTSSSKEFMAKVSPGLAVISAGRNNSYGHPHQSVLDIFKSYGIRVLRTDQSGDVIVISDGQTLKYGISSVQN